ncbi:M48 family metallopeptidase [Microbulbifer bruguierae]|uniref:M48 family metallopeptidase n=1 Tax=Microbulbifer bruguierae TaxID=3029061 RepID=A0ABY8NJR8_9GAMM|nr:M48 family metallopeptidase [Microbulbifer bruguierae]WGL17957.1 M48 family metallopeptidase [Microbulbifer bruguierae]
MNFFQHQDQARRNSLVLTALFAAAVVGLIAITTLFVAAVFNHSELQSFDPAAMVAALGWQTLGGIALTISAIVALASAYRLRQLSDGGRAVAESLGGKKINVAARDLYEQRALNVVEEMALAAGTPVPEVYIIEDNAINAFAAGYRPTDAVIGLTRGAIEQLNREELQGVVAHEFSHIFNGDMRLNIRIVGLLHGILIIGLLGSWLLRGSYWGSGRNSRGRAALLGVGAGLVVIGYTGTFFGNLIKSAVSRQREYLADASAVQFTRNNHGIAGALKKIGGYNSGSRLAAANASEFSHMYFASSLKRSFLGFFATHPPLNQRILRLDPSWNGALAQGALSPDTQDGPAATRAALPQEQITGIHQAEYHTPDRDRSTSSDTAATTPQDAEYQVQLNRVLASVDNNIAAPSTAQFDYGHTLLSRVPADLKAAAHDPFSARAVVYALLIHPADLAQHRQQQLALLEKFAHPAVWKEFRNLHPSLDQLPAWMRLPLLDLCVPALKALAPQQYQVFKRNLIKLIRADGELEIWEWALYRVLIHALEQDPDRQRKGIGSVKGMLPDAYRFLLAAMAHAGTTDYLSAKRAYEAGLSALGLSPVPLPAGADINLQRLDKALAIARETPPLKKPALLKSLATTLAHDGVIEAREIELLRAIADCLDCPMPPIPATLPSHSRNSELAPEAVSS